MEVVRRAVAHRAAGRVALACTLSDGAVVEYGYGDLLAASSASLVSARACLDATFDAFVPVASDGTPRRATVAVMAHPGPEYVAAMFAVWRMGATAVPLAPAHPPPELAHCLAEARVDVILAADALRPAVDAVAGAIPIARIPPVHPGCDPDPPSIPFDLRRVAPSVHAPADLGSPSDGALVIFTSGTTGRPKAALHTRASLDAQTACLCECWGWTHADRIYHCLPMHHVHGIVNAWLCAHRVGATVEFASRFSPAAAWARLRRGVEPTAVRTTDARTMGRLTNLSRTSSGESIDGRGNDVRRRSSSDVPITSLPAVTVFMGVPTMYARLIQAYDAMSEEDRSAARTACAPTALRLAVSGSASCPASTAERWRAISGAAPLERYGATEFGMALSNPLAPANRRRPGWVGTPLPGMECKVVVDSDPGGGEWESSPRGEWESSPRGDSAFGELRVRGSTLFSGYVGRPEASAASLDDDGFFKTGDVVETSTDDTTGETVYRVLGRASADVIKSAGYKVSALEVEARVTEMPGVREVAVVGVPDDDYGEVVSAVVGRFDRDAGGAEPPGIDEIRAWCTAALAAYKAPRRILVVDAIPRNLMGKVNKRRLARLFLDDDEKG